MSHFFKKATMAIILFILFGLFFSYLSPIYTTLVLSLILVLILFIEWPRLMNPKKILFWIITPFYPILPLALMIYMSYFSSYRQVLFYMMIIAFSQDVGGYIFGKLFGKHKLAPTISPKKTWEGFWGGIAFTLLITYIIISKKNPTVSLWIILIISIPSSILSASGDLLESWLKRRAGIKDTGRMLSAHGGLLDRFDSFLLIIFVFFIFRDYFITIFNIKSM